MFTFAVLYSNRELLRALKKGKDVIKMTFDLKQKTCTCQDTRSQASSRVEASSSSASQEDGEDQAELGFDLRCLVGSKGPRMYSSPLPCSWAFCQMPSASLLIFSDW